MTTIELNNWRGPCARESLASLLGCLRQANHYEEKNWLRTLPQPIGPQHPNLLRSRTQYQALAELTGLEVPALYNLTSHRFVPCYYLPEAWPIWPLEYDDLSPPLWEGGGLERYVHGIGHEKICPLCWAEQEAVLLPWSLRHITGCLTHGVWLVDRCNACDTPLGLEQESGSCATCGYALDKLPTTAMVPETDSLELTSLVWSAIGLGNSPFPPKTLPLAREHPLWQMPPAALLRFLWLNGQLVMRYDPKNPLFGWATESARCAEGNNSLKQGGVQEVHQVLLAMWRVLKGWPYAWYTLLERLVHKRNHWAPLQQRVCLRYSQRFFPERHLPGCIKDGKRLCGESVGGSSNWLHGGSIGTRRNERAERKQHRCSERSI